jgi:hypothetical protein
MDHDSVEKRLPDSEIISAEVVSPEGEEPTPNERIAASRWQVLVLLFLAAGPLALPVLARSPRFSPFWKIVLFLLVILQTALVVVLVVVFARWFLGQLEQARQIW